MNNAYKYLQIKDIVSFYTVSNEIVNPNSVENISISILLGNITVTKVIAFNRYILVSSFGILGDARISYDGAIIFPNPSAGVLLTGGYSAARNNPRPAKIDGESYKDVYNGSAKWMYYIEGGGKPVGTDYWNVHDVYGNIEPAGWKGRCMNGAMPSIYKYSNGVQITIMDSEYKNYRLNYIGNVGVDRNELRLYFVTPWDPYYNIVAMSFTSEKLFNQWFNYIFRK